MMEEWGVGSLDGEYWWKENGLNVVKDQTSLDFREENVETTKVALMQEVSSAARGGRDVMVSV